jgi:hypothetical protein
MNSTLDSSEIDPMHDLNIITHYPIQYAKEMFYLTRRIAYLKMMMQSVPPSQTVALNDSSSIFEVIRHLLESHDQTVCTLFYDTFPDGTVTPFTNEEDDESDDD